MTLTPEEQAIYLDCHVLPNDLDGFPSASYFANNMDEAIKAKAVLGEWFDRVVIVRNTNGQSVAEIPDLASKK